MMLKDWGKTIEAMGECHGNNEENLWSKIFNISQYFRRFFWFAFCKSF